MDILIVSTFFPPLNSIASLRPYSWAKYWTLAGHSVTVLTPPKIQDPSLTLNLPRFGYELLEPEPPKFLSYLKRNYLETTSPNLSKGKKQNFFKKSAFSLFDYARKKNGIFSGCRMPDFSDLWIYPALKAAVQKGKKWDVVISSSGPYSVHVIGEKIKKRGMASKWIADYRDTWNNNYIYSGLFPFTFFEKHLEKKLMRSSDAIVTVSTPLADSLAKKYGAEKVHTIENGFDACDLDHLDPLPCFSDEKYRMVHTGSMYLGKRDPSPLFQAIASLSEEPDFQHYLDRLEVLFFGPDLDSLNDLIAQYKVEKWVKLKGFINRNDALKMQRDAHALLFLPLKNSPIDGILTGKMYEYLFSGTPIVALGSKEIEASQRLILETKCGFAFTEVEEIKQFLRRELQSLSKNKTSLDPEFLKRYDRKFLAMKLLDLIMTRDCP